jgi:YHS domain-containing protein
MRLFLCIFLSVTAFAAEQPKLWYHNLRDGDLAAQGYDVVAYFDGEATIGKARYKSRFNGLRYQFSNKANLKKFEADPERFVPQYGGWCAFAMGVDEKRYGFAPARFACDPESFKIVDGKLYLFANLPNFDAKAVWDREDQAGMIQRGDAFWQDRQKLAEKVGEIPEGMHPQAPMETAQFAFLVGDWKTDTKWMNNPEKGTYAPSIEGRWEAFYDWDGFGITDKWSMPNVPGSGGLAYRSFDRSSQKWVMTYIPTNQPRRNVWLMEGSFDEEGNLTGQFSSTDARGRAFTQKVYFYNIKPDSFSWRTDRSYDEGKTWIKNFGLSEQTRIKN